jgi:hypothetical protein
MEKKWKHHYQYLLSLPQYKAIATGTKRKKRYANAVKQSTTGRIASAKAFIVSNRPFVDWIWPWVEKATREWREKIPLVYEAD